MTQTLDFWSMMFVFVLASFIGVGVIRRVSRLLHTPLMSITNAISACFASIGRERRFIARLFGDAGEVFRYVLFWRWG